MASPLSNVPTEGDSSEQTSLAPSPLDLFLPAENVKLVDLMLEPGPFSGGFLKDPQPWLSTRMTWGVLKSSSCQVPPRPMKPEAIAWGPGPCGHRSCQGLQRADKAEMCYNTETIPAATEGA